MIQRSDMTREERTAMYMRRKVSKAMVVEILLNNQDHVDVLEKRVAALYRQIAAGEYTT